MRRYTLHALVLANALLMLALAWLWFAPDGSLRNVGWKPPAAHKTDFGAMLPALPGIATADTSRFVAMLDRPLFSATRRPPPPPPPPAAQTPVDNLSTARLSGVYEGQGAGGVIINLGGKDRRVALNSVVEGWTLQSVQGRSVTFSSNGQVRVLQLPRAALATYTGVARPPVAPAQTVAPPGLAAIPEKESGANVQAATSPPSLPPATGSPSFGRRRTQTQPSN